MSNSVSNAASNSGSNAGRKAPVIAIDGPSGAGKGTIAWRLARHLGWGLLDSGALYRLTAFVCAREGVDLEDEEAVAAVARNLDCRFEIGAGEEVLAWRRDEDVSGAIRGEATGGEASRVAAMPGVRAALLERQRGFRQPPGLVADGRDMGTVVFPDAPLKFFLVASAEERAERRRKQLKQRGEDASLAHLLREIRERDRRDSTRSVSPLEPADDAIVIDSTSVSVDSVFATVMESVTARLGA